MVNNFPKIMKDIKCTYTKSSKIAKQDFFFFNRHIYNVVKTKKKQKILKITTEKEHITYRGTKVKLTTDFFYQKVREHEDILKEKKWQLKVLYTVKTYFKNEGKLKTFSGKEKMREFVSSTHIKKCKTNFFRQKEYGMAEI